MIMLRHHAFLLLAGFLVPGIPLGSRFVRAQPVVIQEDEPGSGTLSEPVSVVPAKIPHRTLPEGPGTIDEGALPTATLTAFRQALRKPIGERMVAISDTFMGLPYQDGIDGEGVEQDPDPPARYDAFDCVTFVEEVLALAMAPDPASLPLYRQGLRYNSLPPSYESRRHFYEMEWIPGNIRDGYLEDITSQLGASETLVKTLTRDTWLRWRKRSLFQVPDDRFPVGTLRLPILPLDEAARVIPDLPEGSILSTVRVSLNSVPIVVSHVGIMIQGPVPMVRHATRMGTQKVRDDRLNWYLEHIRSYDWWPPVGINVLMPREQGPRRLDGDGHEKLDRKAIPPS